MFVLVVDDYTPLVQMLNQSIATLGIGRTFGGELGSVEEVEDFLRKNRDALPRDSSFVVVMDGKIFHRGELNERAGTIAARLIRNAFPTAVIIRFSTDEARGEDSKMFDLQIPDKDIRLLLQQLQTLQKSTN